MSHQPDTPGRGISAPTVASESGRDTLRITEIYRSIQGESTWAGLPCTFVRLARCHIRCVWCDTAYAFHGGESMAIGAIVAQCESLGVSLVELTGGEPLVQSNCVPLARALIGAGFTVMIETSGTLPIDVLPCEVIRIMDLKCPDSGVSQHNCWDNISALCARDEVKFVLASRLDYEWARDVTREHDLTNRCNAVLFSTAFGLIDPAAVVDWILEDNLTVRFQIQTHKVVWPPDARGV